MNPPAARKRPAGTITVGEWLGAVAHTSVCLLLTGFAVLKEDADFWRNSGGWPIWFRHLVKFSFHPLVITQAILLGVYSVRAVRRHRFTLPRLGIHGLVWMVWGVAVVLSVEDNLVELFQR